MTTVVVKRDVKTYFLWFDSAELARTCLSLEGNGTSVRLEESFNEATLETVRMVANKYLPNVFVCHVTYCPDMDKLLDTAEMFVTLGEEEWNDYNA